MRATPASPPSLIGWQTLLADLSLILFMVTAAAMAASPANRAGAALQQKNARRAETGDGQPYRGEPLAIWRGGGRSLAGWLAAEQPDPRQQLTITLRYTPGGLAGALASARALAGAAGGLGAAARITLEPAGASGPETLATLAYDRAPQSSPPDASPDLAHRLL